MLEKVSKTFSEYRKTLKNVNLSPNSFKFGRAEFFGISITKILIF